MFKFDNYLEEMFVFHSKDYFGVLGECDEGTLKYVPIKDVLSLNLWPSDHFFLEKLIETDEFFDFEFVYKDNELLEVVDCANKQKD